MDHVRLEFYAWSGYSMKTQPVKTGHLSAYGPLRLAQTDAAKAKWAQRARGNKMLRDVKVVLDWRRAAA